MEIYKIYRGIIDSKRPFKGKLNAVLSHNYGMQ